MKVGINITGLAKVQKELAALSGPRLQAAMASTFGQVAGAVAKEVKGEMAKPSVFDRPKPYTLRSVRWELGADGTSVNIAPTYLGRGAAGAGGQKIDPQQFLLAQAFGGSRKLKRSELTLRRAGILPAGWFTSIPKVPFPGSEDGHGNIRGPFMVQLLSYFQAFGEKGFRKNMGAKRKAKLANAGLTDDGKKIIRGVEYVVSYGKAAGAAQGSYNHLAPGIWARSGVNGGQLKPVLMFIRPPNYKIRLDMQRIAERVQPGALFEKWLRGNIRDEYRAQVKASGTV